MSVIKSHLIGLYRKIQPKLTISDGIERVVVDNGIYLVNVVESEPIAAVNVDDFDDYYNNMYCGVEHLHELFESLGTTKKIKFLIDWEYPKVIVE